MLSSSANLWTGTDLFSKLNSFMEANHIMALLPEKSAQLSSSSSSALFHCFGALCLNANYSRFLPCWWPNAKAVFAFFPSYFIEQFPYTDFFRGNLQASSFKGRAVKGSTIRGSREAFSLCYIGLTALVSLPTVLL